jgi:AraC-like DNA-binding protein
LQAFAESDDLSRLGLLLQLFSTMASAPAGDKVYLSSRVFALTAESRHLGAMQAAVQFLLSHYRGEVRMEQLLKVTNMSKPTFSRVFKSHSGKSLNEFLQQIRLDAACQELAETNNPVIEVALNSGFSQVSFFNRLFKRVFKACPSTYRKRRQSDLMTS